MHYYVSYLTCASDKERRGVSRRESRIATRGAASLGSVTRGAVHPQEGPKSPAAPNDKSPSIRLGAAAEGLFVGIRPKRATCLP